MKNQESLFFVFFFTWEYVWRTFSPSDQYTALKRTLEVSDGITESHFFLEMLSHNPTKGLDKDTLEILVFMSLWCARGAKVRWKWCDTWWVLESHGGCRERDKYEQDGQHCVLLASFFGFDIVYLRSSLGLNPPFPCSFIKLGSWALSVPQTDLHTPTSLTHTHTHTEQLHTLSQFCPSLWSSLCVPHWWGPQAKYQLQ